MREENPERIKKHLIIIIVIILLTIIMFACIYFWTDYVESATIKSQELFSSNYLGFTE
jgi:hypothetical protein